MVCLAVADSSHHKIQLYLLAYIQMDSGYSFAAIYNLSETTDIAITCERMKFMRLKPNLYHFLSY